MNRNIEIKITTKHPIPFKYVLGEDNIDFICYDFYTLHENKDLNRLDERDSTYSKTTISQYIQGFENVGLEFELDTFTDRYIPVLNINEKGFFIEKGIEYMNYKNKEAFSLKVEEETNCFCTHVIKKICFLFDIREKVFYHVGCCCIKRHYKSLIFQSPLCYDCQKYPSNNNIDKIDVCKRCYNKRIEIKQQEEKKRIDEEKKRECPRGHIYTYITSEKDCKECWDCPECKNGYRGRTKYGNTIFSMCRECNKKNTKICPSCKKMKLIKNIYKVCYDCNKKKIVI